MRKERTLILLGACGGIAKSILKLVTQEGYDILAVDITSFALSVYAFTFLFIFLQQK